MEELMLIAKGAEADLWLDSDWNGVKAIIKKRGKKKYRHIDLDRYIRRSRTIHEAEIIHRVKTAGVSTPFLYQVDPDNAVIVMEFVEGKRVRDLVNNLDEEERNHLFKKIGEVAGLIHKLGVIHGDLTTSNMILRGQEIVLIDFGLSEISDEMEKRGVDLNLMKKMLQSTHFKYTKNLFEHFKEGYIGVLGKEALESIERMEQIARRGRYFERE